jgi:GTP cyclohydrolase I
MLLQEECKYKNDWQIKSKLYSRRFRTAWCGVVKKRNTYVQMRGIQKQNSVTTTSSFTGAFER